jgi:hypothetical protein
MDRGAEAGASSVLHLRHLDMLAHIRRAEDPAWRDRLERQQALARLGRRFAGEADPLEALRDHARAVKEALRAPAAPRRADRG